MRDVTQLPAVLLYVPGDRPDRFAKAAGASPAIILDLEDAVPAPNKEPARRAVADYLASVEDPQRYWVRVGRHTLADDLSALQSVCGFGGIMLADALPETLAVLASDRPELPAIALVESASALTRLAEMAAAPNVVTFAIGEVDLLADLGIRRTKGTAHVIDTIRLSVVQAAAAGRLLAPIAPTSLEVRDTSTLAASTEHLRDLGFRSRTAVHPNQCAIVQAVFTLSEEEITEATEVLGLLERAGGGVTVDVNGRLVDDAVVRSARAVLARAAHNSPHQGETA